MEPEANFYEGVGRVVVAAAKLDVALAMLVVQLGAETDYWAVAARPGFPLRELRRLASQLPQGDVPTQLRRLVADAETAFEERNRVTHSVLVLDFPSDVEGRFKHRHPRRRVTADEDDLDALPSFQEMSDQAGRINAMGARAIGLQRSVAEFVTPRDA